MEKDNAILIVEGKTGGLFQSLQQFHTPQKVEKVDYREAPEALGLRSPRLVIFDLDHQRDEAKKILGTFSPIRPQTSWVISTEVIDSEELVDFIRLGAADYLRQPVHETEFQDLLRRMDHLKVKKDPESHQETHKLFSFFSCKGGVGVSFLTVNLAVALTQKKSGHVLVADFVLQHGNLADLLDMNPSFTLLDLTQNVDRLDAKFLENSLPRHRSGVSILARPKQPEESELFLSKETPSVLQPLKESFDYVLLDGGHEFNATTLSCLDVSDLIFTVTTPDLPSLCNTKIALETFEKLGYPKDKVKLVLNRWHMKEEIESSMIEKHLSHPIFHKFPDDPSLVLTAMNRGVPLAELSKNSKLAQSFEEFAGRLAKEIPPGGPNGAS